jgi:phage N-6-adenine-methyltransferase
MTLEVTSPTRFPNGLLIPGGNPDGQCYRTPRPLFDKLHRVFHFTVDACASPDNALLPRYWTVEEDALGQDWSAEVVFCNPPFNNIGPFLAKARTARRAVVLAPLNFCTATGFHASPPAHLVVPDHRIKFVTGTMTASPVLGTALLVYGPLTHQEKQALGGVCLSVDPLQRFLGRVFYADALDLLRRLPTNSIDAVITDPMYGACKNTTKDPRIAFRGAPYDWGPDPSNGDPVKHGAYHRPRHEECRRVLKPGGVLAWASSPKYAGQKGDGKYAGLNKEWFGPHTEWVLNRRCRRSCLWSSHLWLVQTKEQEPITVPSCGVIYHDRKPQMPKGYKPHPCSKPWEELAVVVGALTKPGDVLLDCFCGLGSTLIAAERLGRLWIGCDISPNYCKFAMRELARVRRQRPL